MSRCCRPHSCCRTPSAWGSTWSSRSCAMRSSGRNRCRLRHVAPDRDEFCRSSRVSCGRRRADQRGISTANQPIKHGNHPAKQGLACKLPYPGGNRQSKGMVLSPLPQYFNMCGALAQQQHDACNGRGTIAPSFSETPHPLYLKELFTSPENRL